MADNLRQISSWTMKGFHQQQKNIDLYLKLSRKDLNELQRFPLPKAFLPSFKKLCKAFDELEGEYREGISDHREWATSMQTCAADLVKQSKLV